MKKSIIVICTLLLLLTFCLTACAEKETEQENLTCKEMLNRVLKADSITVECNGKTVFVADNALRCVAEGTGILLENLHLVK